MAKAIVPAEFPALPEGANSWARSTKRRGGMFHAHAFGMTACRSVLLDRHQSRQADSLGDLQYFGVCPRCMAKVPH